MPNNRVPIRMFIQTPRLRTSEWTGTATAIAIAAWFSRAIARFMQSLLLALHESRVEQARREIHELRHLIPAAKEATKPHVLHRCGGDRPTGGPAHRAAQARRKPPRAA